MILFYFIFFFHAIVFEMLGLYVFLCDSTSRCGEIKINISLYYGVTGYNGAELKNQNISLECSVLFSFHKFYLSTSEIFRNLPVFTVKSNETWMELFFLLLFCFNCYDEHSFFFYFVVAIERRSVRKNKILTEGSTKNTTCKCISQLLQLSLFSFSKK